MGEKARILIVDDDTDILKTLSTLFSLKGYTVETAESAASAIEKSKLHPFNIALIDIVLPDMQGTQLLTKLQDTEPKMRKIIVTGHATLDNAVDALNLGANAYIMKPIDPQELLKVVEEQLREQQEMLKMTEEKITEFIKTRVKQLEQEK